MKMILCGVRGRACIRGEAFAALRIKSIELNRGVRLQNSYGD